jgi:homoserine dehydrogenase
MGTTNKIKLYGFGVVGQGFQSYLSKNENAERLHTIIVKDDKKSRKIVPSIIETTNPNTIRDKDVDVVLELISSSDEAYGIVAENLEIGKKVISANKKLIAENLAELIKLEQENNGIFLYEGAVCGSIPIIRVLNDLFVNENLTSVSGIFNGSSNYILTKLFNENVTYDKALKQAQDLGFAEADPTSDVGGFDSLYKLLIITAHAFGKVLKPEQVLNLGIDTITKSDVDFAKQHGLKIKLVAKVSQSGEKLNLSVLPTLVSSKNDLFNIENEYNGVVVEGKEIGTHFYKGKGAGSYPTGSVVYADLKAIDNNYRYSYKKLSDTDYIFDNDDKVTVILHSKDAYNIKNIDAALTSLYPLDVYGKRFIAKISLNDLQQIKYDLSAQQISLLAIEDDNLIELLTQTSFKEEVLV